jgi:hypothetical protein
MKIWPAICVAVDQIRPASWNKLIVYLPIEQLNKGSLIWNKYPFIDFRIEYTTYTG